MPIHNNFRLWITTEPHSDFPLNLLHMSIKVTNEPPQGIKAGLKRTFASLNPDIAESVSISQWKTLLYATAFLHVVLLERRKYGSLGFNVPYEFQQSDLESSLQFLQNCKFTAGFSSEVTPRIF
jgi:dynein heavy chain